ncbi:MAG: hypothetical protein M3137_13440 [Actinomycetota bacterium]|nr:hypothetical protein [Actinomycetota bacterium]
MGRLEARLGSNERRQPHWEGARTHGTIVTARKHGIDAVDYQRWRNFLVDDIDHVVTAEAASAWQTADNYNHAQPFNAIDNLTIAVTPDARPHAS